MDGLPQPPHTELADRIGIVRRDRRQCIGGRMAGVEDVPTRCRISSVAPAPVSHPAQPGSGGVESGGRFWDIRCGLLNDRSASGLNSVVVEDSPAALMFQK